MTSLFQGLIMPAKSTLVAQWFPPVERGTAAAIYSTGNQLASIVGNPVSAFLCSKKDFLGGWPAIFYTSG
jgi:ACS family glucarate transporter-like MFS transporter